MGIENHTAGNRDVSSALDVDRTSVVTGTELSTCREDGRVDRHATAPGLQGYVATVRFSSPSVHSSARVELLVERNRPTGRNLDRSAVASGALAIDIDVFGDRYVSRLRYQGYAPAPVGSARNTEVAIVGNIDVSTGANLNAATAILTAGISFGMNRIVD